MAASLTPWWCYLLLLGTRIQLQQKPVSTTQSFLDEFWTPPPSHHGCCTSAIRSTNPRSDVHAWSALLPCKSGPAMAACNPSTGPGLILVSPAPTAGAEDLASAAGGGGGGGGAVATGGKRGAPPRALGGGGSALAPSELFLSQVYRDERSASVVLSAPQAFAAHASPVTVAAFSAGGDRLVTCDGTGVVLLWANLAAPESDAWAWATPTRPMAVAATTATGAGITTAQGAGTGGSGGLFGGQHGEGDYLEPEEVEEANGGDGGGGGVTAAAAAGQAEQGFGLEEETPLQLKVPREAQVGRKVGTDEGEEVANASAAGVTATSTASTALHPTTSPMGLGRRGAKNRGYTSMLDQTPPPVMQTARRSFAAMDAGAGANQRTAPGQLEQAIKALQTVVDDAAAVVGEGANGGGGGGRDEVNDPRQRTPDAGLRRFETAEVARFEDDEDDADDDEIDDDDDNHDDLVGLPGSPELECAAKTRPISPRARSAPSLEHRPPVRATREATAAAAAATAAAAAPAAGTGGMTCVTWHPASARLIYGEGASLFAEDLETCRRFALSAADGGGGGGRRGVGDTSSCVAVSADGDLVARGTSSRRTGPSCSSSSNGGGGASSSSSSCLSVWCLGGDDALPKPPPSLPYGAGNGDDGQAQGGRRRSNPQADHTGAVGVEVVGDGGVVALAFSPSGSDLCSVGEWDGGRCLLRVRPTSGLVGAADPRATASEGVVTQLSARTSAICMLPAAADAATAVQRRGVPPPPAAAARGAREPFLFATGGDQGVGLWRRVFDDASSVKAAPRGGGRTDGGGGGRGRGGVSLLGTSAGWRATALASVGRFVVGADVDVATRSSSEGPPGVHARGSTTVTAIDASWLAAGGHEGEAGSHSAGG